jgi:CBS-domain-containing membrane protein
MQNAVRTGIRTSALLVLTGVVAVLTGRPFLFPSLGPSAYLLATAPDAPTSQPERVIGGHLVGVVAGLVAYHLLASGLVVTEPVAPVASIPAAVSPTESTALPASRTCSEAIGATGSVTTSPLASRW